MNWNIPYKAVQGGFLVLRPDKSVYEEYIAIVRKGDFQEGKVSFFALGNKGVESYSFGMNS